MMLSEICWQGVNYFLDRYVELKSDDYVLVVHTPDSTLPAAWVCLAIKERSVPAIDVWMMPIVDDGIQQRLTSAVPEPTAFTGRLIVITLERDTMSHDTVIKRALARVPIHRRKIFRAISASEELFSIALRADPAEIGALNESLLDRLAKARTVRIKTKGGSDLCIELDNLRHQWISNRGDSFKGGVVILPAGEVATYPTSVNGKFVADFAFNVNAITDRDTRLRSHPVTVQISNGVLASYECDDPGVSEMLRLCFEKLCARNVGELGFGTNRRVSNAVRMNSHINERRAGVHLGFGQHNQAANVVSYNCALHLDLISSGGFVWTDDDPLAIDLETFEPWPVQGSVDVCDQDVFSPDEMDAPDCCGILRQGKNGLALISNL